MPDRLPLRLFARIMRHSRAQVSFKFAVSPCRAAGDDGRRAQDSDENSQYLRATWPGLSLLFH